MSKGELNEKRISLYVRSVLTFLRIVITKIFNIKVFTLHLYRIFRLQQKYL